MISYINHKNNKSAYFSKVTYVEKIMHDIEKVVELAELSGAQKISFYYSDQPTAPSFDRDSDDLFLFLNVNQNETAQETACSVYSALLEFNGLTGNTHFLSVEEFGNNLPMTIEGSVRRINRLAYDKNREDTCLYVQEKPLAAKHFLSDINRARHLRN